MKADQLKHFAEYLAEGRPSLYHVSKAMAEILILERSDNLPIIIVRPSIVTASMREPYPVRKLYFYYVKTREHILVCMPC